MKNIWYYNFDNPIGELGVIAKNSYILSVFFSRVRELPYSKPRKLYMNDCVLAKNELMEQTSKQLNEYFKGNRQYFDLPLSLVGTSFQQLVWNDLKTIPYGKTFSYSKVAENIGSPNSSRAVGTANNKNPIAIIVPCHRVIGKNGKLSGYAGGIEIKNYLLELEKQNYKKAIL